jgi:tellurite resistance protein
MAFDIRAIFTRSLGGRDEHPVPLRALPDEDVTDGDPPESPITAAGALAVNPETDDMAQGGATRATALIPEGVDAIPTAAIDDTSARGDDEVWDEQAICVSEVAVAAAMLRGPMTAARRDDLLESLREVPGLESLDDARLDALVTSLSSEAPRSLLESLEARLAEIVDELTDPSLRRAAYQLAVFFSEADGSASDEEFELLEALADVFEISDEEARTLRETTLREAGIEDERAESRASLAH